MALIVRNDEQIKVGTTPGLVVGASSFTFDGTSGKPDYRQTEIVISELTGRGILVKFLDYTWNPISGRFDLIQLDDIFSLDTYYNVHFQPLAQPLTFDHYSFINSSFFIRDINLVNLGETKVLERLNYFIAKYEPECLKGIMGTAMYNVILTESSQRVTDIAYGTSWVGAVGIDRVWDGLVHSINISLIADYVYVYFQRSNALQTTGVATKASKPEAGVNASPRDKIINAWQFFANESQHLISFLWNQKIGNDRVYPEFTWQQYAESKSFAKLGGINYFDL